MFIEPLAAAFRVPEQVAIGPKTTPSTVVGDGKLGLLCAWVARGLGADRDSLVGKHPEKLALAGEGVRPVPLDQSRTGSLAKSQDVVDGLLPDRRRASKRSPWDLVKPCGTVVLKTTVAGHHST